MVRMKCRAAPVVEVGLGDGEDAGELGIVGGHELGLGRLLADCCQALNVFHAPERLLPQLQLARHLHNIIKLRAVLSQKCWKNKLALKVHLLSASSGLSWQQPVAQLDACLTTAPLTPLWIVRPHQDGPAARALFCMTKVLTACSQLRQAELTLSCSNRLSR